MATIYVDTALRFHRKVRDLDACEAWFYVSAIAHSHAASLDGFVDANDLDMIVLRRHRSGKTPDEIVARLVAAGLLDVVEGGWKVHDYLKYQQSAAEIEEYRVRGRKRAKESYDRRRNYSPEASPEETRESSPEDSQLSSPPSSDKIKMKSKNRSEQSVSSPSETMAASPPGPSQPPERRTKKPPSSTAQRVWEIYDAAFFVDCGAHPDPQDYYFVQINRLLKRHTPEEIGQRLKNYFESPPWVCREGSRDFGRFLKFFDQLAVAAGETGSEMVDRVLVDGPKRAAMLAANGHRTMLNGGTP